MEYSKMSVAELKQESRNRGLTLELKGHKFNKAELIERLQRDDEENNETWNTAGQEETKPIEQVMPETVEVKEEPKEQETIYEVKHEPITVDTIEQRYSKPKNERVYENDLQVGSMVIYVRYIETRTERIIKKLASAKVIGVNRKKELVRVQTPIGEEKEMSFEELLFIKNPHVRTYPKDIGTVLFNQREESKRYREQKEKAGVRNAGATVN